jgi:hypothetical protein
VGNRLIADDFIAKRILHLAGATAKTSAGYR